MYIGLKRFYLPTAVQSELTDAKNFQLLVNYTLLPSLIIFTVHFHVKDSAGTVKRIVVIRSSHVVFNCMHATNTMLQDLLAQSYIRTLYAQ